VYLPVLPNKNPAVFGVVIATKFWLYLTAMVYFLPTGILQHYVWMHLLTIFTVFIFYKLGKSDPGLIPKSSNINEIYRVKGGAGGREGGESGRRDLGTC